LCGRIKAYNEKKYDEYDDIIKIAVAKFLSFIKEVISNDNEECYNFILKWLSNLIRCMKNQSA
jgi:hypothetical protein